MKRSICAACYDEKDMLRKGVRDCEGGGEGWQTADS